MTDIADPVMTAPHVQLARENLLRLRREVKALNATLRAIDGLRRERPPAGFAQRRRDGAESLRWQTS